MSSNDGAILVFTKGTNPEDVKTRLSDFLSPEQRFELHIAFIKDTLEKVRSLPYAPHLYVMGNSEFDFRLDLPIYPQEGIDLGSRLANAFASVLKQFHRGVVIGTDSPDLPADRIEFAFAKLTEADVVLGPTEDGGYYLLGLSHMIPEIFQEISWGTNAVLKQTLQKARNHKVALLEPHYDVDVIDDLHRLRKNLERDPLTAPNTNRWFSQHALIQQHDMPQSAPE
ncbi:MAG TPA: TIGR04282 family arsenosugar biosynthesis glycosyltransferase [Acidobacteriota bacterium]|nr:TIGR04282 family arsenosugar biosynthesis glycosyltransferase [Acidobacteriota bacterium]